MSLTPSFDLHAAGRAAHHSERALAYLGDSLDLSSSSIDLPLLLFGISFMFSFTTTSKYSRAGHCLVSQEEADVSRKKSAFPLALKNIQRIAIVSSDAGPNPDGASGCTDRGCQQGTLAMGWGSGTASFPYLVDPLQAIMNPTQSIDPTVDIAAVLNHFNLAQVGTVARLTDACLVFALIAVTAAACSNTVVITHTIGSVTVEDWVDNPNVTAVLHAGVPGQETGNAVVEVLFSDSPQATNPFWASAITYKEELGIDGRWFDIKNITPTVRVRIRAELHHLRVQRFAATKTHYRRDTAPENASSAAVTSTSTITPSVSSLSENVSSASVSTSAPVSANATSTVGAPSATSSPVGQLGGPSELYEQVLSVSFRVQNTGDVAGNEVSQLYLTLLSGYGEPPKVLRGFSRNFSCRAGVRVQGTIFSRPSS
ncbi:hypothetical protein B0H14DRAFT_3443238 [Mycena olivaceomarginata]|nr:hypothetical protein B0H14DRAFT_3443238 [Mycena olivaceomarginata]